MLDLSFSRFEQDLSVALLPTDLAVLMVGVAARQAASPTALAQAQVVRGACVPGLLCPGDGAFCGVVAALLNDWKHG